MTQTEKEAIKSIVAELAKHIEKIEDFIEAARNSDGSMGAAQVPAYIQARMRSRLDTHEINRMLEEL
jgi:hypothetical protein